MSAEVVKKRGRPKKVVSESVAAESMEPIVKGTRKKSTTASITRTVTTSNKSAEVLKASTTDASITSAAAQKKVGRTKTSPVATKTMPLSQAVPSEASAETNLNPPKPSTKSSSPHIIPASSKILNQVRALSSKAPLETKATTTTPPKPTKPISTNPTPISETSKQPSQPPPTKPSSPKAEQIPPTSPHTSTATPQARPSIPIAALNSTIVSQLSARSGARPSRPSSNNALPPNYKPVARKVTMAIVALPIAIVTSWVLYNRLVLGEDRKHLVRPGLVAVEDSPSTVVDEKDVASAEKNA